MRALLKNINYLVKEIKNIRRQSWIEQPDDATIPFSDRDKSHLNIRYFKDAKKQLKTSVDEEKVQPLSPKMGPYTVKNPKIYNKKYRWCACGQSLSQPFCDGSHQGTSFTPYRFTIEENVKEVELCGCKKTQNKPFCDGNSCQQTSNIN